MKHPKPELGSQMSTPERYAVFIDRIVTTSDADIAIVTSPTLPEELDGGQYSFIDGTGYNIEGSLVVLEETDLHVRNLHGLFYWRIVEDEES